MRGAWTDVDEIHKLDRELAAIRIALREAHQNHEHNEAELTAKWEECNRLLDLRLVIGQPRGPVD